MKLSRNEKLILGLLTFIIIGMSVIGLGFVYVTYKQQPVYDDIVAPTVVISLPPKSASSSLKAPTSMITFTPTPTFLSNLIYTPFALTTPTPIIVPSLTPFTIVPRNTPIPNPPQQNPPQQNPPQQNPNQPVASNCSPKLDYAKSVHQYNLARIDSIYDPLISLYENYLQQAIADRDALGVVQYQRKLDSEKNQKKAAINAENKRYESEVDYIKSTCK
jgi:hypothetical protein